MTDREEAGLRGSVRICVEETTYPTGKSLTTTEYGPDGRLLTTRASNSDGSECFTTKTYEADGRLVKTSSAKSRSEEHTSELQSQSNLVCRLLLEKKKRTSECTLKTSDVVLYDLQSAY